MSSGGKGGSSNSAKNVHGTLIGACGWGPIDWIEALIHNGNYLWQGTLDITDDVTDLTGAILDPSYVAPGGALLLYRGTDTQPADFHGARDKGSVKLESRGIFFGQGTGSAPNLQIIGGRIPRISTSIVEAVDNVRDDGQVNPVAAFAEILTDDRGAGYDLAFLDSDSWKATAHWCADGEDRRKLTFCSPYFADQKSIREVYRELLEPLGIYLRWTKEGKLGCYVYEWGIDDPFAPILDARHWKEIPRIPSGDWTDIPTELTVGFVDRDFEHQDNTVQVPNARAYQVRQEDDPGSIDRPHVTRIEQAYRHANEELRRLNAANSTSTQKPRGPFAANLEPGQKIKIDVDPEPGGDGLAQLARVEKITITRSGAVTLEVKTDNLVPSEVYAPSYTPPTPTDEVSPPLVHFMAIPLPPSAFGWPPSVGVLASRPAGIVRGFEVYFSDEEEGSYAVLGQQAGFAVRCALTADADDEVTTIQLNELDGLDAPDANLAALTPGGNVTAARDNAVLAIIAQLDGDGRVELAEDGDPIMEFVSIVDRESVSGAVHDYTVLRGRMGTKARAWTTGAIAWIIPRNNLYPWRHSLLSAMIGSVAYLRFVSFTARATDESTPIPETSVNMPPATAPSWGGTLDGDGTPDDGEAPNSATSLTAVGGLGLIVFEWIPPNNVPMLRAFIYESSTDTKPFAPSFALQPSTKMFFRDGLGSSVTRYYWVEYQARNGKRALAGPVSATTKAGITLSDVVEGLVIPQVVEALLDAEVYDGAIAYVRPTKTSYVWKDGIGWDPTLNGTLLANGSIYSSAFSAAAVTASAIGANEVITNEANIKDAIITSAKILSLAANKIDANYLSAIQSLLGNVELDSSGSFRTTGATGIMTGKGIWMGYDDGQYKFRVGDPDGPYILWDGFEWTIVEWPGGVAPMAPLDYYPTFTNGGTSPYRITFSKPSGYPDGWGLWFSVGGGAWRFADNFPFTETMSSASQNFSAYATAPGYTQSQKITESWNSLFL